MAGSVVFVLQSPLSMACYEFMESNHSAQLDEMTQLHCIAVLEMQSLRLPYRFRRRDTCKIVVQLKTVCTS